MWVNENDSIIDITVLVTGVSPETENIFVGQSNIDTVSARQVINVSNSFGQIVKYMK